MAICTYVVEEGCDKDELKDQRTLRLNFPTLGMKYWTYFEPVLIQRLLRDFVIRSGLLQAFGLNHCIIKIHNIVCGYCFCAVDTHLFVMMYIFTILGWKAKNTLVSNLLVAIQQHHQQCYFDPINTLARV